jgi:predicted transcriptional regulator
VLLLSIRPNFADQIFNGIKKVEFRRRHPRQMELGSTVLIYASSPTCALIGFAVVFAVDEASPKAVWNKYHDVAGIDHCQFKEYFATCSRAVAIRLRKPVRFDSAISLNDLRCKWPGFHPPQQFAYLSSHRLKKIARFIGYA